MRRTLSIVLLVLTGACAVGPTEFSESGLHIAASVNRSWDNFDNVGDEDIKIDSDETTGFGGRAGFRFWQHFAVEVAYEDLSEFNVGAGSLAMKTLMAQGKAYLFTDRFQPYGLIGIGYTEANLDSDLDDLELDEADLAYRLGAGLEVYLLPIVYVFAEGTYTWPQNDLDSLDYYTASLGVGLRF